MPLSVQQRIREAMDEMPLFDVHSHLGHRAWQATCLADIVSYHWLSVELTRAAGRMFSQAAPEDPDAYMRDVVPYFPAVRNTVNHYAFMGIMRDLYGVKDRTITEDNWQDIDARIREHARDSNWFSDVMDKCNMKYESVRPFEGCPDWNGKKMLYEHGEPLYAAHTPSEVKTLLGKADGECSPDAIRHVITTRIDELAAKNIRALHVWPSEDWTYREVDDDTLAPVLQSAADGENLDQDQQDIVESWCADVTAERAGKHGMVIQIFHGSKRYAKSSTVINTSAWNPALVPSLAPHFCKHRDTHFDLFLATRIPSHEAAMLTRIHFNLSISGAWWHAFTPTTLLTFFRDRLEVLPNTIWNAFYSDGYLVEWVYGKQLVTKNRLSHALAGMVEEGFLTEDDALDIARRTLHDNAVDIYKVESAAPVVEESVLQA